MLYLASFLSEFFRRLVSNPKVSSMMYSSPESLFPVNLNIQSGRFSDLSQSKDCQSRLDLHRYSNLIQMTMFLLEKEELSHGASYNVSHQGMFCILQQRDSKSLAANKSCKN